MEVVKCAFLDTLIAKCTQHVVQKYALAITFFSCIHFGFDWDEHNRHLFKNQNVHLLPHFHGALHFGMLTSHEFIYLYFFMSRGSSSSIVSDYGLDDRAIEVRSPTGAENFSSSPCVETGSGAHPASFPMGTGGPFPGGKARPGRDADHSPHLVQRLSMSRSYASSPPKRLHGI
jgi:hypothetical protein